MSIMTRTANLRDLLENLFDSSSPLEHAAFCSETSLFHFAEAGVTPIGDRSYVDFFACTITSSRIQIFFYKSGIINSRCHIRDENLTCWHDNDKLIAGRGIGGIKDITSPGSPPFLLPRLPLGSLLSQIFSFFAMPIFSHFPTMQSLVPG